MNDTKEKDNYPNKISEKELEDFSPCKLCGCEYTYTHFDDCVQSGCKGHVARLDYETTSETFSFDFGDGRKFSLDRTQMKIVNDFLIRLKS